MKSNKCPPVMALESMSLGPKNTSLKSKKDLGEWNWQEGTRPMQPVPNLCCRLQAPVGGGVALWVILIRKNMWNKKMIAQVLLHCF